MKKASPTTTTAPTGQIAPFGLRMLPELRARIEEEARASGRSMNAEIVQRLQASLDDLPVGEEPMMGVPMARADHAKKDTASAVYILLDAAGYPLSWEEIRTIWSALIQDQGLDVVKLEVQILTPDMESSSARAEQATALAERLRAGGKSVVLGKRKRRAALDSD